jgi:hypothetical protein
MADLTLQDFRELFNERLVRALSYEKQRMFGEKKFHAKKSGERIAYAQERLRVHWLTPAKRKPHGGLFVDSR